MLTVSPKCRRDQALHCVGGRSWNSPTLRVASASQCDQSGRLVFALSCGGSGALDRAGARASLAVPAAGGIHDDLVTPYLAAACV